MKSEVIVIAGKTKPTSGTKIEGKKSAVISSIDSSRLICYLYL